MRRNTLTVFTLWALCLITTNILAQNTPSAMNSVQVDDIFYHTVERGQTVYSIAKMYDVKVEDIYRLNIGSDEAIKSGDKLKIPQKKTVKSTTEPEGENGYIYHTIQPRETLYGVSKKYGVSGENIVEANPGLSHVSFSIGKTIRIPVGRKQKPATEIVENTDGVKEIYHTVPARETMYNLCKTFRTSEKELLKLNPELAGGLRKGMTIRIPLRINEKDIPRENEPDAGEVNAMLHARHKIRYINAAKIALLLPYNAEKQHTNTTEKNRLTTEYYEGLLLAVDSLRNQGYTMELFVYDIGDDISNLRKILKNEEQILKEVNLIIGGVSIEQIKLIADFAQSNKIKYVIPYTSKSDEVLNNACIFQVNTPQNLLYANAAYAGANLFAKYNIIFLDTKDKDDQTEFINEFKRELKERNISHKDAVYEASNFPESIESLLSTEKSNVIMPVSSSLDALAKIKTVLSTITKTKPEYKISLFGYPIWQTYTKDCLEDFHTLDTYIYSLFYADNMNPNVKMFYENYKNWYSNTPPMSIFPKYGMLGFDTGMFFLGALQAYGADFENNLSEIRYKSLQTGFNFERVNNWGGYINTNVYIIHYNRDYTITRSDFR
ncbi:MAG: LysM peptidoglycan-binding domain-containing protein [Tannerella sp.]|jgi:LysM repeat protein/ABC-type branched-subunit amino acid transport system substrate-binding protein|nr:LysM peptidoglycan-binding domain-containing protein [Tannerella sp.]